jgi:hypothetical protein
LSAGKDKRENFERLLREGKLGGMAVLRNLRLMLAAGVEDAAAGLAILLREKAEEFSIATFSDACVELPPRRGFALRDAIVGSQAHSGTYLKRALSHLAENDEWRKLDRLIVITDEQSHDGNNRGARYCSAD